MSVISTRALVDTRLTRAANLTAYLLWLLWQSIRLPMFLLLAILEPVVSFVLGSLALLGVLTALSLKFYGVPHFPFALMLGVSVGLGLMLAGYYALLRLLSR